MFESLLAEAIYRCYIIFANERSWHHNKFAIV